jgi:glycerol kinase
VAGLDPDEARDRLQEAVLASLNSVLAEPIEGCIALGPDGQPCIETRTTADLEESLGMPGGNIFHGPLSWPFAEDDEPLDTAAERWGVATAWEGILLCGAGSRRGGGVSGLGGWAAARAVLEATSWQTREVVDAMYQDSGVQITTLKVDGGMTKNNLLMQHQADVLDVPVVRPKVSETTCLGAAYAAGLATGVWNDLDELKSHWQKDVEWTPNMEASVRDRQYHNWRKAVEKSFGWEDDGEN